MAKPTRASVTKHVRSLGGTVEDNPTSHIACDVEAWAPEGFVWKAVGTHVVVAAGFKTPGTMADIWRQLAEDTADGLEPCTEPECDVCSR